MTFLYLTLTPYIYTGSNTAERAVHMHLGECNYRRAPTKHGRGRRGIYRGGPAARVPDLRGFEATIMARNRCPLACSASASAVRA